MTFKVVYSYLWHFRRSIKYNTFSSKVLIIHKFDIWHVQLWRGRVWSIILWTFWRKKHLDTRQRYQKYSSVLIRGMNLFCTKVQDISYTILLIFISVMGKWPTLRQNLVTTKKYSSCFYRGVAPISWYMEYCSSWLICM